jgi:hypothetical protein
MHALVALIYIVLAIVIPGIPSYVIGQRRGAETPGLAFVPAVGPVLVLLWSTGHSGWLCLLALIPLVNIAFWIWLAIVVPKTHGRSGWWSVGLIFLSVIVIWFYAFTLDTRPEGAATA